MANYTDKYQSGAITNSMLEAAESCPLKFRKLYLDRVQIASRYKKVLDAMSLGILVHEVAEVFPVQFPRSPVAALLERVADWRLSTEQENVLAQYLTALDMVRADGLSRGRVYTAPTMTSYWKTHYSGLDKRVEEFNADLNHIDWLCDIQPMTFLLRAAQCLQNYKDLLPQLNAGCLYKHSEMTFHTTWENELLAGTIDRLDYDPALQGWIITDYKTGAKAYTSTILHNLNQLQLYAYALRNQGMPVVKFRIASLERNEIVEVNFSEAAYKIYLAHRLPRQIKHVKYLRDLPIEDVPVLAGRSFSIGCPCVLATLTTEDACPAVFQ